MLKHYAPIMGSTWAVSFGTGCSFSARTRGGRLGLSRPTAGWHHRNSLLLVDFKHILCRWDYVLSSWPLPGISSGPLLGTLLGKQQVFRCKSKSVQIKAFYYYQTLPISPKDSLGRWLSQAQGYRTFSRKQTGADQSCTRQLGLFSVLLGKTICSR